MSAGLGRGEEPVYRLQGGAASGPPRRGTCGQMCRETIDCLSAEGPWGSVALAGRPPAYIQAPVRVSLPLLPKRPLGVAPAGCFPWLRLCKGHARLRGAVVPRADQEGS